MALRERFRFKAGAVGVSVVASTELCACVGAGMPLVAGVVVETSG